MRECGEEREREWGGGQTDREGARAVVVGREMGRSIGRGDKFTVMHIKMPTVHK